MQLIGLALLGFIVWFGFADRESGQISAFDMHALVMVIGGSAAAIMTSSSRETARRTLMCLRELLPSMGQLKPETDALEAEREKITELWREGKRAQAVEVAEKSSFAPISEMLKLILSKASGEKTGTTFMEMQHAELSRWQPAISNWELLAKLGPSFGMVGTITGMIQLFKNMGADDLNIGAAMSLALLATLYGVAFGAGVAGPIGHYLRGLLDERLGVLERCEQSVRELVISGGSAGARG